jgi:hypothetical protein
MDVGPKIYVVCSDRARNGKTLLARLYTDFLLAVGRDPMVIDFDSPKGKAARFYPEQSIIVDLNKVSGQMTALDTILMMPERDYVIDLPARLFSKFFDVVEELNFIEETRAAGMELIILFIVEPSMASLNTAKDVYLSYPHDRFIAVRNEALGHVLDRYEEAKIFFDISSYGEIALGEVSKDIMEVTEDPEFSFRTLLEGENYGLSDNKARRLRGFAQLVFGQIRDIQLKLDIVDLKKMGLV